MLVGSDHHHHHKYSVVTRNGRWTCASCIHSLLLYIYSIEDRRRVCLFCVCVLLLLLFLELFFFSIRIVILHCQVPVITRGVYVVPPPPHEVVSLSWTPIESPSNWLFSFQFQKKANPIFCFLFFFFVFLPECSCSMNYAIMLIIPESHSFFIYYSNKKTQFGHNLAR